MTGVLCLGLVACSPSEYPSVVYGVLDGRIGTDGFPLVVLTKSLSPDETDTPLNDKLIRWAKVTVSDGENEVVLTGGPSSAMFPPYRYYTYRMEGEPGKRYTVHAVGEGVDLKASAVMPRPTDIEAVVPSVLQDDKDKYSLVLKFKSPQDGPAYYYVTMRNDIEARTLPAFLGTIETGPDGGKEYSLSLMRPKIRIDSVDYEPYFLSGEVWEITLNRVDKEEYRYWRSYNDYLLTGSTPLVGSSENLKGNVEGGYGIWSVCGSSTTYITIP